MTDREKMIELLDNFQYDLKDYVGNNKAFVVDNHIELADHLIANGVTTVVRCAGCKWYDMDSERCQFWYGYRHPAHYCGEGERRNNVEG